MRRVLQIMFHQIGTPWSGGIGPAADYCISLNEFEKALNVISRKQPILRWQEIDADTQWVSHPDEEMDGVLLTFDDGYREHYELAIGLMQERGWAGIFFICTGFITREIISIEHALAQLLVGNKWDEGWNELILPQNEFSGFANLNTVGQFKSIMNAYHQASETLKKSLYANIASRISDDLIHYMSSDNVRTLADSELHQVGLHTYSHPYLPVMNEESTLNDLDESWVQIQSMGQENPTLFAYPYGGTSEPSEKWLSDRQFDAAFITEPYGFRPQNPSYAIPRLDACSSTFKQWIGDLA